MLKRYEQGNVQEKEFIWTYDSRGSESTVVEIMRENLASMVAGTAV